VISYRKDYEEYHHGKIEREGVTDLGDKDLLDKLQEGQVHRYPHQQALARNTL
jgi:hypothetical protein